MARSCPLPTAGKTIPMAVPRGNGERTKKQLSASRVRGAALTGRGCCPSEEPLEAAGSWEGRSPGKMLGVIGCSMAQPWGRGKCAGSDPPPCLTGGSNLDSEEKLSPLPPWASMTPAQGQRPLPAPLKAEPPGPFKISPEAMICQGLVRTGVIPAFQHRSQRSPLHCWAQSLPSAVWFCIAGQSPCLGCKAAHKC